MKYLLSIIVIVCCLSGCSSSTTTEINNPPGTPSGRNGGYFFVGSNRKGMFRSSDRGATWSAIDSGINLHSSAQFNSIAFSTEGTMFVSTTSSFDGLTAGLGVFRSTDSGKSWRFLNIPNGGSNYNGVIAEGDTIYAFSQGFGLFRSTNDGATWNNQTAGLIATSFAEMGTSFLLTDESANIWMSSDRGVTWKESDNGIARDIVQQLFVSGTTLFASTAGSVLYRSTDQGNNWTAVATSPSIVETIATIGTKLYAGTHFGLYSSTDDGEGWTQINGPLNNDAVLAIAGSGDYLIAGTYTQGLFRSTDAGSTWNKVTAGLTDTTYTSAAVR